MRYLLIACTLLASACAPVLVPAPRARYYRPVVYRAPAPVVVVRPHRFWW